MLDYVLIRTVLQSRARGALLILCVKLGYSWIADRKMRTKAVMKGQKIKSIILNLPSYSHELAEHEDLCVPDTPPNEEKDSEGYFRCSARCGLVFKAKASMNRYIVSLIIFLSCALYLLKIDMHVFTPLIPSHTPTTLKVSFL